jgi:hypothetical protein
MNCYAPLQLCESKNFYVVFFAFIDVGSHSIGFGMRYPHPSNTRTCHAIGFDTDSPQNKTLGPFELI